MNSAHLRRWTVAGVASAASLGALVGVGAAHASGAPATVPSTTVVASHLNTPKYLRFGPGGLFVAESGTGGHHCVGAVGVQGTSTQFCAGTTGSILRIHGAHAKTVISGLPSAVEKDTGEVVGPAAVAFDGRRPVILTRGLLPTQTGASAFPGFVGKNMMKLLIVPKRRANVRIRRLGDLSAFAAANPQSGSTLGGLPGELLWDSDPHDVVNYKGGWAVADAGANDVVWVHRGGQVSLIARLPTQAETAPAGALGPGSPAMTIQAQAVPSSITVGPDGALYVGILRGIPSLPGTAQVYRVVPGQAPTVAVSDLSRVSDIAFNAQGRLLILESNTAGGSTTPTSTGGVLQATLNPSGPVQATNLGVTGLVDPTGIAVGPAGAVFITNNTGAPGQGQVVKVTGLQ